MRSPVALGFGSNANPWWDPDGRTARRQRRRLRRVLEVAVSVSILAVLMLTVSPRTARAGAGVNLDQWASTDVAWQNGNLNGGNSRYPEGGIVPFRLAIEGLKAGNHTIHINYDVTAGGHKAYDFLATWNVTNAGGRICSASGGGISSMCPGMPASSSMAFPFDGYSMDSLTTRGAQLYSAAPRRLTIWGGTIQSVSAPVHSGSSSGNSTADVFVRFRSTGAAVLLAWGGHLGQSAYWNRSIGGPSDGAAMVSGAPWHMRTLQLDGAGNKNQDRSIQPSAIVGELPPFALRPPTPTPRPTPAPPAPRATPRPTTPPGNGPVPSPVDPGNPTTPGTPATQAGDPPGVPPATVPPTFTDLPADTVDRAGVAIVAAILGSSLVASLMLLPILRRRRRS